MTKRCSKCGETKPLNQFVKDKRYRLGVFCWCHACRYLYNKIGIATRWTIKSDRKTGVTHKVAGGAA